jgi:hypothetical protein
MEATETDIHFPQSRDQVEGQVDGIAGGIMDLLDNPDPNSSGEVEAKKAEPETGTTEPETGTEEADDEPTKYTIKWQGQEKEVTQDELLDLAQKGFDYTKKTQTLAEERDQLSPYIGLANKIKNDPFLANQIAALMSGQPQVKEPEKPKFDDPIEQLKYEMKQETIAELRKEMAQNMVPLQRQQALNQVKMNVQSDPDYKEVHSKIIEMVKSQPPAIQKTMYLQLDQDPTAYLEVFQHYKNNLSKAPLKPEPVKKETKAPILESGGVSQPSVIVSKEKQERISKQKAKAMRSGDNSEIAAWLQSSGALEHLY